MSCQRHVDAAAKAVATRQRKRAAALAGCCPTCGQAVGGKARQARTQIAHTARARANSPSPHVAEPDGAPEVYTLTYLVPGKDHRSTIGKATFRGKVCTSIAYWGFPIPRCPPQNVLDALRGLTLAGQAVGRLVAGGDPPSKLVIRPAVFIPPWVRRVVDFIEGLSLAIAKMPPERIKDALERRAA